MHATHNNLDVAFDRALYTAGGERFFVGRLVFENEARCPRQDLNLRTRFRKPLLYPLSYEGTS